MLRLQQIFRALGNESSNWFFVSRFLDVTNVHDELRALDSSPTTQPFKSIVLDLSTNYAYEQVLRQVRKSSSGVEGGSGGGGDGWYVYVCVRW